MSLIHKDNVFFYDRKQLTSLPYSRTFLYSWYCSYPCPQYQSHTVKLSSVAAWTLLLSVFSVVGEAIVVIVVMTVTVVIVVYPGQGAIVSWMMLMTVLIQPSYQCLSRIEHQTITPPDSENL